MVIGLFVDVFPPFMDGVANVVLNYALNLKDKGHTVYVVCGNYNKAKESGYDEEKGWDFTYRLPVIPCVFSKPYGIIHTSHKSYKELMSIPFDIIHIHSPFYMGRLGRRIAKRKNIPLIGTLHSQFDKDIKSATFNFKPLASLILKLILKEFKYCDELWAVSNYTKMLFEQPPYNLKNVGVCENACELVLTQKEIEESKKAALEFLGQNISEPILLFIGQHHDKKNIPNILSAYKILLDRGIKFKALFVGQGPHMNKYMAFVKNNKMEDIVRFLGLITDRKIIAGLYAISYLFVFPSYYDAACIVKREAAFFHVPTLFGKGSVTSEGVKDKYNGYLAEDTPEAIADAIEYALNNSEEKQKIGDKAYETIYSTWNDIIDIVEKRYINAIENRRLHHK